MEAKDSKGNIIKAGDTVKVLRKWTDEVSAPIWRQDMDKCIGNEYTVVDIVDNGMVRLDCWRVFRPQVLEKVQATETFKVLITGYVQDWRWYKGKIGDIIEVDDFSPTEFKDLSRNGVRDIILKSDCHVIEPTWKVMKDAEETGRDVEMWDGAKWYRFANKQQEWNIKLIYRLAPEPKQPEYEPYSYNDREKLRGLWVRRKGEKGEEMITAIGPYRIGTSERLCPSYSELFEKYETLDGQPVGKLK